MMTPFDKFKSLPNAEQYLKAGITFKELDDISKAMTDNELLTFYNSNAVYYLNIHEDKLKSAKFD